MKNFVLLLLASCSLVPDEIHTGVSYRDENLGSHQPSDSYTGSQFFVKAVHKIKKQQTVVSFDPLLLGEFERMLLLLRPDPQPIVLPPLEPRPPEPEESQRPEPEPEESEEIPGAKAAESYFRTYGPWGGGFIVLCLAVLLAVKKWRPRSPSPSQPS